MSTAIGRISTLQFSMMNRAFISRTSVALQEAGLEVSTGRRADIFADLGPRAASSITLRTREDNTQAYLASNDLLQGRLQVQLESVDAIRAEVTNVLQTTLANASSPLAGAETLVTQARAGIDISIAQMNVSFDGQALFGGTRSNAAPLTEYTEVNPATGRSPKDVIDSIITGPPTTIAEVNTIVAELDAVFSSTAADPLNNFESTFFIGTPLLDGGGLPSSRVTATIEPSLQLSYGVQANDEPFREIYKGFAMLASFDVTEIADRDVYTAWMSAVSETLGNASLASLEVSTEIGFNQKVVENATERLENLSRVHQTQLGELEGVDSYEAATRLTNLEVQLRASYEVTSQLSALSLLNYL